MEVLGRKVVKHNPWFVFSLWVVLIAIGMLEAWAILLQGKDYPTWQYMLFLGGIIIVGLCWLYGMFVSAKRRNCENKGIKFHQSKLLYPIAVTVMVLSLIVPIFLSIWSVCT